MSVTALVEETEKYFVWTIEEKRAKKVEIEVGVSSFDEVEVISGLKKGDIIITRPPSKIEEGDKIAVIGKVN
jgi:Trk K+ transport system NAD-binding subunit